MLNFWWSWSSHFRKELFCFFLPEDREDSWQKFTDFNFSFFHFRFRLQVNVRTMCVDGARDVIFKSATKCSCYFCKKYWTLLRDVMVWTKEGSSYTTNKQKNPVQNHESLTNTGSHSRPSATPTDFACSIPFSHILHSNNLFIVTPTTSHLDVFEVFARVFHFPFLSESHVFPSNHGSSYLSSHVDCKAEYIE